MKHITLPTEFIELLPQSFGSEERRALINAITTGKPYRAVRLNKIDIQTMRREIPDDYEPVAWSSDSYYINEANECGKHVLHKLGAYYIQEPSAMAVARLAHVERGMRVLDLCASPGGKSGQIARLIGDDGFLLSNEIDNERSHTLKQNLQRLGVVNAVVTNANPIELAERFAGYFDRVFVDAPCTGEGMIRRGSDSLSSWSVKSVNGSAKRQLRLLEYAAGMVKPGGALIYSTCTFNRIENEDVVSRFLDGHAEYALKPAIVPYTDKQTDGLVRLFPHNSRGEGQFAAVLIRGEHDSGVAIGRDTMYSNTINVSIPNGKRHNDSSDKRVIDAAARMLRGVLVDGDELTRCYDLHVIGDRVCAASESIPKLSMFDGLRVRSYGLEVARTVPGCVVPSQALAFAINSARARYAIDDRETQDAQGFALCDGFILSTRYGLGLGFGRLRNGSFVPLAKEYVRRVLPSQTLPLGR